MKKPSIGDRITHVDGITGQKHHGEVVMLLSAQFVYVRDETGMQAGCMFSEDWAILKKASIETKDE